MFGGRPRKHSPAGVGSPTFKRAYKVVDSLIKLTDLPQVCFRKPVPKVRKAVLKLPRSGLLGKPRSSNRRLGYPENRALATAVFHP